MPGSSLSVAEPNIILNTAVAEALDQIYETLKDVPENGLDDAIQELLKTMIKNHKKILFNGNGYTDEWVEEAARRGLYNLKSLPDAVPQFIADKNVELFTKHHIFSKDEIYSRYEILLENYAKTLHIESLAMQDMVKKDFTPALFAYINTLTEEVLHKKELLPELPFSYEKDIITTLSAAAEQIMTSLKELEESTACAEGKEDVLEAARSYHDQVLAAMESLRLAVDQAEALMPSGSLPYPTYDELLFSLR